MQLNALFLIIQIMQKFQELLTQAAQLKQSQLKNERKNYESLPEYLKAGLNFTKKYKQLRKQNYLIQITMSQKVKKDGNNLFKNEQFIDALAKYQQALGVFRYIDTKSYDNMKDEDLIYESYTMKQEDNKFQQQYKDHLTAIYLNICSCLTKLNRKEDSLHSADQALKIQETAKAYYKKAQCYLHYINKQTSDIKLGFYYLNKCYEISKDQSIIQQMHLIKKQIDEQRDKEKKWFKFMFDKVGQQNSKQEEKRRSQNIHVQLPIRKEIKKDQKISNIKNMQKQRGTDEKEEERLQKTKQKLFKYVNSDLTELQWIEDYQGDFIQKHGSKIYSIIQLYGYRQYLGEYKSLLAQCLDVKKFQSKIQKKKQIYDRYFNWLKSHPIDKISKYVERYELQTQWISQHRNINNNKGKDNIEKLDEKIVRTDTTEIVPQLKPFCNNQHIGINDQKNIDSQQSLDKSINQQQSFEERQNKAATNIISDFQKQQKLQNQMNRQQQLLKNITEPKIHYLRVLILIIPIIIITIFTVKSFV